MSLFVFFTTTMSVSFTLRETQSRMLRFTGLCSFLQVAAWIALCLNILLFTQCYSSLKFSVQLQHHARHQLPTFQLIFVHVIESLVFVPVMGNIFWCFEIFEVCVENVFTAGLTKLLHSSHIILFWSLQIMIGILFFLFEFYDDQLLAFLVLTLVWLCELFTMIR